MLGRLARSGLALVLAFLFMPPGSTRGQTPPPGPVIHGGLPIVSPDGSRIVFQSNRGGAEDLFIIGADGTGETQLTRTPEAETARGWTPGGKQIVFSVFANDTSRLFAIDPDGRNQREIGSVPGRSPVLSPDGKRVVYMSGTWTAMRLMVSTLDGSNAKQITDGSSIAWNSQWSPDGSRIAFTGRTDPKSALAIFVMNADGSQRRQVTHLSPEEGQAQWPVWSPDARRLAVQASDNDPKVHACHIGIVDFSTGDTRKIAVHSQTYFDETPSWFPDGKRIAFQSDRTGRMEVWVMNDDGSGQRQVTGR
jgi:TolB protein